VPTVRVYDSIRYVQIYCRSPGELDEAYARGDSRFRTIRLIPQALATCRPEYSARFEVRREHTSGETKLSFDLFRRSIGSILDSFLSGMTRSRDDPSLACFRKQPFGAFFFRSV